MNPTKITPAFRAVLACKIISAFRSALERNKNCYDGGMIPNITSIRDCMILSDELLARQLPGIADHDANMIPTDEEVKQMEGFWDGSIDAFK